MKAYSLVILVTLSVLCVECNFKNIFPKPIYQSEWAVQLEKGGNPKVLESLGYENLGPVANLKDTYLVRHRPTHAHHQRSRNLQFIPSLDITNELQDHPQVKWCAQQLAEPLKATQNEVLFSDPLFPDQWHLQNTGQFGGTAGEDINIIGAWNQGFTGNGVRIAIVDDGIQTTHPDLESGYRSDSSFDFNDNDANPDPDTSVDFHGTAVAGVALARNNTDCGVGSAFFAEIAGIRLTALPSTDVQRAEALSYRFDQNHIFSASFGPTNTEFRVAGRGTVTEAAMRNAVQNGRGGLGSIYVFAAGNGAREGSNCNYNGFANAIETIAVGAIDFNGNRAEYSELCAAILVSAPSGDSLSETSGIRTTDLVGEAGYDPTSCTISFSGTSASCPLVSGVIALMLEANPNLSYRDVQDILVRTSTQNDPSDSDWQVNGAGLNINHQYGFGRIDATAAVNAALNYSTLGDLVNANGQTTVNQEIPDASSTQQNVVGSVTITDNFSVERVVVTVFIDHPTSGDLQVELVSPSGTESILSQPHADIPTISVTGIEGFAIVGTATFGPQIDFSANTRPLILSSTTTGCETPANCNAMQGNFVLINLGSCLAFQQVQVLQNCGAAGVVFISPFDSISPIGAPANSDTSNITIPSVLLSRPDGENVTSVLNPSTTATLQRIKFPTNDYLSGWPFSSVRNWGERSSGVWTVRVWDGFPGDTGMFNSFRIDIYGNSQTPSSASATIFTAGLVWITILLLL